MPPNPIVSPDIDSFDPQTRLAALADIIRRPDREAKPADNPDDHAAGVINMHIHSFYSYNVYGYSPAHVALECKRQNFYAAGLCDFDVLDGLEEFYAAGQMLGLRTAVHIETRAFLREYARVEINSPGEPGVTYIMGAGFGSLPARDSAAAQTLNIFREQANLRNRALVSRINTRRPEIAIDYETEVMPLAPGGCPTERHIVKAYQVKARHVFTSRQKLAAYWSELLGKSADETAGLLDDGPAMDDKVRALLAKNGGIGYVRPDERTFPPVDAFIAWVLKCGAIPMVTWLDGTSQGESDLRQMLECLKAKGAAALNIIPDRNHNLKSDEERRIKLQKLNEVILAAREFSFPINIGTEMNKNGQPFFDDLTREALTPYREDFLRGAKIMIGQSVLARYAGFSYCGQAAQNEFGRDAARKNNFFEAAGKLAPLNPDKAARLKGMGKQKAFQCIHDSSVNGKWKF